LLRRCSIAFAALWTAVVAAALPAATAALAQDQFRIGLGYGFAFLPLYVCEDLKLVEKQAKAAHLDLAVKFAHFASSGELHTTLAAGQIDIAPFGTAPLLAARLRPKRPAAKSSRCRELHPCRSRS